jgi:hypothetical protein
MPDAWRTTMTTTAAVAPGSGIQDEGHRNVTARADAALLLVGLA